MHTGASHQMAYIIGFKIQPVMKFTIPEHMLTLSYNNRRVHISIFSLGLGDDFDNPIHQNVQLFITCNSIDECDRFEPFVKITVMPFRTPMSALFPARSNKEIVIGMADFRILKQPLHIWYDNLSAPVEPVVPESLGPSYIFDIHTSELDASACGGIG
jgi:hypothetical protein